MTNFTAEDFALGMMIILEISTLVWAYEAHIDTKHEREKSEMQRRVLKEWIDNVIDDWQTRKEITKKEADDLLLKLAAGS